MSGLIALTSSVVIACALAGALGWAVHVVIDLFRKAVPLLPPASVEDLPTLPDAAEVLRLRAELGRVTRHGEWLARRLVAAEAERDSLRAEVNRRAQAQLRAVTS